MEIKRKAGSGGLDVNMQISVLLQCVAALNAPSDDSC